MPKMGNIFNTLHVRKSTKGTSNELSFSVLDAAKQAADERHGEARRVQQLGKIDLFSGEKEIGHRVTPLTGEKASADPATEPEIPTTGTASVATEATSPLVKASATAPKSEKRSASSLVGSFGSRMCGVVSGAAPNGARRGVLIALVCAIVAVLGAFVVLGISGYAGQRSDFNNLVIEAVGLIEESEAPVIEMNNLLADPSSEESRASIGVIVENLSAAEKSLSHARAVLTSIEERATTHSERETAARLSKDITGRQEMVSNGRMILICLESAQTAMESLDEAWSLIAEANEAANEAARLVSSKSGYDEATSRINVGLAALGSAAEKATAASEKYPAADLTAVFGFLENKTTALQKEAEAIQALKNLDATTARARQAEYETYDEAAQRAAESITDIDKPIIDAYQAIASDFIAKYEAARTEVALSDEYLRDFLGQASK